MLAVGKSRRLMSWYEGVGNVSANNFGQYYCVAKTKEMKYQWTVQPIKDFREGHGRVIALLQKHNMFVKYNSQPIRESEHDVSPLFAPVPSPLLIWNTLGTRV